MESTDKHISLISMRLWSGEPLRECEEAYSLVFNGHIRSRSDFLVKRKRSDKMFSVKIT